MRPFLHLFALTLTGCLAAPAMAEKWYEAGTSEIEIAFADRDSIERDGKLVEIAVFHGFEYGQGQGSEILYARRGLQFDCNERKVRQVALDVFGAEHAPLGPRTFDMEWAEIEADTSDDAFSKLACGGKPKEKPHKDPFAASDAYWDQVYAAP